VVLLRAVAHLPELQQDPLIRSHLSVLYDTLLEQNLVRVIEPYSSVQLTWIAQEVGQDVQVVEEKLSQMILDQVFYGVLNENEGTLEIIAEHQVMFSTTLEVEKQLQQVVKQLYEKVS
jgi:26S proteasome regulatory subunit N6